MNNISTYEEELERHGKLVYPNVGFSMMPLLRQHRDLMVISRRPEGRLKKYDAVTELIETKFEYRLGAKNVDSISKRKLDIGQRHLNLDIERYEFPIYIDGYMTDVESVIIKKNTAMIVSEILQCSRQNVDTIMRRGNANKIRELDYVALQYVERHYGGNRWN